MKIIGITGKSGSGKTTFSSLLAQKLNCRHVDIDKIGHDSLYRAEISDILLQKFGAEIFNLDGSINRKKLGNIVFTRKDKMEELNNLTWSFMQQQLDLILSQETEFIILDWMLLPETQYWEKCDYKILVESNTHQRKETVIKRDNISEEYFDKRDSASIDYSQISFDYKFQNDYKKETVEKTLNEILSIL